MVALAVLTVLYRLPGPPLSKKSLIAELLAFDVLVGIGVKHTFDARNTRFDLAWV